MSLNASKIQGNSKFPRQPGLEAGTYPAALVQVIDLGRQEQQPWQGEAKDPVQMIYTTYELADEFVVDADGTEDKTKPRWISEDFPFYGLSSDRAKSTKRYLALDPEQKAGGDWTEILGNPAMITITRTPSRKNPEQINNYIHSTQSMRAKDVGNMPGLLNPTKVFSLSDPDMDVFKALPEWLQDKIKGNLDFEGSLLQEKLEGVSTETPKEDVKAGTESDSEPEENQGDEADW